MPAARTRSMASRYTSVLPEPVTPSTTTTSPRPASHARAMAASASVCPCVRRSGRAATALLSVVFSPPRTRRRSVTATTPLRASAATAEALPGSVAASSAMRIGPDSSAWSTARWRTAFARGLKEPPFSARLTQRSSTGPLFWHTSSHGSSAEARRTLTVWPGARNGRRASHGGQAYSRAIQKATRADTWSKALGASTRETGSTRAASRPSGGCADVATT